MVEIANKLVNGMSGVDPVHSFNRLVSSKINKDKHLKA